ncbi:MAG: VanZ family protein [Mycobacteriales bacterium]
MTVLASVVVLFAPSAGGMSPFPGSDKVVHLLLFAGLAFTTRWRFGPVMAGLAAVAGYAALSEVVQAYALPGRSGDPYDVLADLTGAALGWLLARRVRP